jgi:hypothetical protein
MRACTLRRCASRRGKKQGNKGLSTRDASNCHREVDRSPQRGSSLGGPVVTCRALGASGVMSAAAHTAKAQMVVRRILLLK